MFTFSTIVMLQLVAGAAIQVLRSKYTFPSVCLPQQAIVTRYIYSGTLFFALSCQSTLYRATVGTLSTSRGYPEFTLHRHIQNDSVDLENCVDFFKVKRQWKFCVYMRNYFKIPARRNTQTEAISKSRIVSCLDLYVPCSVLHISMSFTVLPALYNLIDAYLQERSPWRLLPLQK